MKDITFILNKQNIWFYLLFSISWQMVSCKNGNKEITGTSTDDAIPVQVVAIAQGYSNKQIYKSGTLTTDDETFLSFKNGGIIDHIYVREGDAVTKGQLLATVKNTEVSAGLQQAVLASEKADRDYQRTLNLYTDSVATLEQLQNTKTAADIAKQQITMVKFNQNISEIRATTNGYVLARLAVEGQTAAPGMPVIRINGAKEGNWFVKVGVNDQELNMVNTGDGAQLYLDAFPNTTLTGTVDKKSQGIDPLSGTFIIYIKINGKKPPALADGMFAKAVITSGKQNSNWKIPYNALLDGQEDSGYVFITNDEKTARRVPVVISSIDRDGVTISSGLEGAKLLIISGSAYLNDGSKIKITKRLPG